MTPAPHGEMWTPPCFSAHVVIDRNRARQLILPSTKASLVGQGSSSSLGIGRDAIRVVRRRDQLPPGERALLVPGAVDLAAVEDLRTIEAVRWLGDLDAMDPSVVLTSFKGAFQFRADDPEHEVPGLRDPQLGAVHSLLGYWTTKPSQPATVVMPTGTGKTETMVAVFVAAEIPRLLVLVPSDALRDQIAEKFETFGVLQAFGIVSADAHRPVVGRVRHGFTNSLAAQGFARACNVLVATPSALAASPAEVRAALLGECSHLFVDEAHHVAAATWRETRESFEGRPVVQFTATPFREDGRHLGGQLLYSFPLREAQRQGYFSEIDYVSVIDFDNPDEAIARRAVEQLREDLAAGLDHLVMARVNRIGRAWEILDLYAAIAAEFNPVIIHSRSSQKARAAALEAVRERSSRIIVCVDMLGEGFDLPALKIAAIHDAHKSLGVTLQFVGRFARVGDASLGRATAVVGRPDLHYDDTLRKLYAEDADWNLLIRDISEATIGHQQELSHFEAGFTTQPEEVSIRNLLPKMSAVVYKSEDHEWRPDGVLEICPEESLLTVPIAVNQRAGVAWFVTKTETDVRWGDLKTVEEVAYDLYVLYWDAARRLLYVNSSNNDSVHEDLAKAVAGEGAERIRGETVFRVMGRVKRMVPTNIGVLDIRNRARRFSMHVGADVSEGFPVAEAQTKTKTNIFAYGFEDGSRTSIGASLKGRVWSYRVAGSIKDWVDWCDNVGAKLTDDGMSLEEIMAHFIRPEIVEVRPPLVPLAAEWPFELFLSTTEEVRIEQGDQSWPLVDVDLELLSPASEGPIRFRAVTPGGTSEYEIDFSSGSMQVVSRQAEAFVVTRRTRTTLAAFLTKVGLIVHFEQDATIVPPGMLLKLDRELPPFDLEKLRPIDWSGINLRKESQGPGRDADSIQARTIEHLLTLADWDVVIDDDGTGEIADIVALKICDDDLKVVLVHCKYSGADTPGARVADLYEVCGQAQKSVRWKRNVPLMFRHLIRREKNRIGARGYSGIVKGDGGALYRLEDEARGSRVRLSIVIAQPGVAKARVGAPMLELLASTEVYLHETALADLTVFCAA